MALRRAHAQKLEPQVEPAPPAPTHVRVAADDVAIPSPARALQAELEASWREEDGLAAIPGRWSNRKSLAFMVGASALLWAGIIGGVGLLVN